VTTKYQPSDDGETIDDKMVTYLQPPTVAKTPEEKLNLPNREATATAQAAALVAAAKDGIPFCEECEKARKALAKAAAK
jgi:hypothetical protein